MHSDSHGVQSHPSRHFLLGRAKTMYAHPLYAYRLSMVRNGTTVPHSFLRFPYSFDTPKNNLFKNDGPYRYYENEF